MATRLTNDMREAIAIRAVRHRFAEPIVDLRRRRAVLANFIYGEQFKGFKAEMDALPDGWLPEDHHITVHLGTSYAQLYFNGQTAANTLNQILSNPETVWRRMRSKDKGRPLHAYTARDPETIRYDEMKGEEAELKNRVDVVWRDTLATLRKFTTVEKLLAQWPEIEPFTKGVAPTPPVTAVMVPVSKLNEALGLPVDEETV